MGNSWKSAEFLASSVLSFKINCILRIELHVKTWRFLLLKGWKHSELSHPCVCLFLARETKQKKLIKVTVFHILFCFKHYFIICGIPRVWTSQFLSFTSDKKGSLSLLVNTMLTTWQYSTSSCKTQKNFNSNRSPLRYARTRSSR